MNDNDKEKSKKTVDIPIIGKRSGQKFMSKKLLFLHLFINTLYAHWLVVAPRDRVSYKLLDDNVQSTTIVTVGKFCDCFIQYLRIN